MKRIVLVALACSSMAAVASEKVDALRKFIKEQEKTDLSTAARANDDPATAERLEKAVDAHLVRTNGLYYLDLNREWRIGATAHRIIALAIANGASFRRLVER